jgi:hypothetical protein
MSDGCQSKVMMALRQVERYHGGTSISVSIVTNTVAGTGEKMMPGPG